MLIKIAYAHRCIVQIIIGSENAAVLPSHSSMPYAILVAENIE